MIEDGAHSTRGQEVLAWLGGGPPDTRTLGELPNTLASREIVEELYAMGAARVAALDVDVYEGGHENAGKLLITLPNEGAARAKLFEWAAVWADRLGYDAEVDVGQKELLVGLD